MRYLKHLTLLAVLSSFLLSGCWPHQAGPTEVGVRTVKLGIFKKKGVDQTYYAPGKTYFFMPIINDWNTFDTKLQTMEMTFDPKRGDLRARDANTALIRPKPLISYRMWPRTISCCARKSFAP